MTSEAAAQFEIVEGPLRSDTGAPRSTAVMARFKVSPQRETSANTPGIVGFLFLFLRWVLRKLCPSWYQCGAGGGGVSCPL